MLKEESVPASWLKASRPATTHPTLQMEQYNLFFPPSFIHPDFEAATASICGGLDAYVEKLKVDNRFKKASVDPGLYSGVADDDFVCCEVGRIFESLLDRARVSRAVSVGVDVVLDGEFLKFR